MKTIGLALVILCLHGCTAVTIADIGVVTATGKTTGSHALSEIHKQDCDTLRILQAQEPCRKVYYGQSYYKQ